MSEDPLFNEPLFNSTLGNSNSTSSDLPISAPALAHTGSFLIGLLITLAASVVNAVRAQILTQSLIVPQLGLNLQKLSHLKQGALPKHQRRPDYLQPIWLLGISLYILSQLVGSTLALQYLRAEYVAPLGSASLIFNVVFSHYLTGSSIGRQDVIGTALVICGVIGVVGLSQIRDRTIKPDYDDELDLSTLHELWNRPAWIAFIVLLEVFTVVLWFLSSVADDVLRERTAVVRDEPQDELAAYGASRRSAAARAHGAWAWCRRQQARARKLLTGRLEAWTASQPDIVLQRIAGMLWGITGGLLSGQTITYAKSVIALLATHGSVSFLFIVLVLFLAVTAVAQIVALNKGLHAFDSTLVVPVLFALYALSAFVTSLTFLQQLPQYSNWTLALIGVAGLVLLAGVYTLSAKKLDGPKPKPPAVDEEYIGEELSMDRVGDGTKVFEADEAMDSLDDLPTPKAHDPNDDFGELETPRATFSRSTSARSTH